ncbi:MAG: SDR family oxidoreductase, partial [Planctomycetaceae bacterium]|nr:SDR family oxidoreductase [Planctomycetaceae bacterium]
LNFAAFERLVKSGVDTTSPIPPERWLESDYCSDNSDSYRTQIRRGGFIKDFKYDWKRHKIPPKQISTGNPLQYMILDVVDTALESAGFIVTKKELDRDRTGVIVGSNFCNDFLMDLSISYKLSPFKQLIIDLLKRHGISDPKILSEFDGEYADKFLEHISPLLDEAGGFTPSALASRITKIFDLRGGCVAVDAGSASAFAAISQAVGVLRENENDLVICAAGSNNMSPVAFISYEKTHANFSSEIVPAEGAAVLIMKRLSDVKQNNNNDNNDEQSNEKVLFLIHGVGTGFDADIEAAYSKAINQAWDSSGLSREQLAKIKYVGVASNERQSNELSYKKLKSFYSEAEFSNIAVQIGDTQAASGMASLLSTIIVTNNHEQDIDNTNSIFCAVSASDVSGIVYHILIEVLPAKSADKLENQTNSIMKSDNSNNGIIVTKNNFKENDMKKSEMLVENFTNSYRMVRFAGREISELRANLESRSSCSEFKVNDNYRIIFITDSDSNLTEQIAYSLQHLEDSHAEKILLRKNIVFGKRQSTVGKIAFLFSGQGSQHEGMLKPLVTSSQIVRKIVDEFDSALQNAGILPFSELAWGNRPELKVDVLWTQISLFAADLILFNTAKKIGIVPDIVAGHSYGEYPAITAAGGWSIDQGISATKLRCNAIINSNGIKLTNESANSGCLLATQMNEQAAIDFCNEMSATGKMIFAANFNSPKQTVFGAYPKDIQAANAILAERKIPSVILAVPRPFHTPLMDSIREPLNAALMQVPTGEFSLQFLSSVSNRIETAWSRIHKNLANQLIRPVRFVELVNELLNSGYTAFIECGPGNVLTGLSQKIIAEYRTKKSSEIKPICVSLDVNETDKNKKNAAELQLLVVRGLLEVAGHFDSEQKIIADKINNESTGVAKEILTNKVDTDIIVTEKIRRKLRKQADYFNLDTATKISNNEPIPQFIIDLAKKAAVCPESLFAYWKSYPNDDEIFVTKNTDTTKNQPAQTTQSITYNNKLPLLSQNEYSQILDENREEPAENVAHNSTRFVPRLVSVPLAKTEQFTLPVFGRVLIIGDSPIGIAFDRLLRANGVDVVSVRCNANIDEMGAKIDEICRAVPTPHCFVVPSREEWNSYHAENSKQSIDQWNPIDWKQNRDKRVLIPFAAIQHWYRELTLNKELFPKGSVYVTTFLGGSSGFAINETENEILHTDNICGGTLAGLTKSIFLEAGLATQFQFRAVNIDLPASFSSKQGAEILLDEWIFGSGNGEIAYIGAKRHQVWNVPDYLSHNNNKTTYTKTETVLKADQTKSITVKPQGVWVVTGGARGITAFTARQLAKDFGIKLNLIGSSPLPVVPNEWLGLDEEAKKILQKDIMLRAKRDGLNPISEWNKTEREIDLVESLKKFDDEGVSYDYFACDVSDSAKLELTFDAIRRKHGAISGVLHGAGLDFSAAFQKKDLQRVAQTYAVKVDSAAAIMYLLRNDPLKHFIAFGSCSGRIGSIGQTDYALANDALAKLVSTYAQIKRDCRCICFEWGPWDEIGMAMKSGIKNSVALKGYLKVPPTDAYKFIVEELGLNVPDNEVVICDWKMFIQRFDKIRDELNNLNNNINIVTRNQKLESESSKQINVTKNIPLESTNLNTQQQDQKTQFKPFEFSDRANRTMKRMIVRMSPRPKNNNRNDNIWDKTQFQFSNRALIYGDNPDAWVLAEKLLECGVKTIILPEIEDENIAIEKLQGFLNDGNDFPLHLFIMSPRNPLALFDPLKSSELAEHWQRRRSVGVDIPAVLLREWLKIVTQLGKVAQSSVAAAISLGGDFATGNAIESQSGMIGLESGFISGLLKGLYAEHGGEKRDRLIVRIIDAPNNESPIKISETIINELNNGTIGDKYGIESAIIDGQIMTTRIIDSEIELDQNHVIPNKIKPNGVWIVTGGTRGITVENINILATRYKLKIHILGQQPLPQTDQTSHSTNESHQKNENDKTLQAMRELGIDVTYHQCDITNYAQLEAVIDKIHKTDGQISGLVHGVDQDYLPIPFLKAPSKDFCNEKSSIITSTFDSAISFMQLLKNDPLDVFILFGSISGRFGVKCGQAYSAVCDALSKLPRFYRRIQPQSHLVAFHWTNWNDAATTTSTTTNGTNEIQKTNLLQPRERTERLIEELESGNEFEIVIGDDEYYRNVYSYELKLKLLDLKLPLADKINADQIETVWNPTTEVLIADHRLADKPILPAAFMIELILESGMIFAEKYTGSGIIETKNPVLLRNFDIAEGLRFFTDTPLTMRTAVNNFSDNKNQISVSCRLLSTFANSKGVILNPNRFHASADVLIYSDYESIPIELRNELSELLTKSIAINGKKFIPTPIQYVQRGSRMYHGATLQELQWIAINGSEIMGESITQPIAKIVGDRSDQNW